MQYVKALDYWRPVSYLVVWLHAVSPPLAVAGPTRVPVSQLALFPSLGVCQMLTVNIMMALPLTTSPEAENEIQCK